MPNAVPGKRAALMKGVRALVEGLRDRRYYFVRGEIEVERFDFESRPRVCQLVTDTYALWKPRSGSPGGRLQPLDFTLYWATKGEIRIETDEAGVALPSQYDEAVMAEVASDAEAILAGVRVLRDGGDPLVLNVTPQGQPEEFHFLDWSVVGLSFMLEVDF